MNLLEAKRQLKLSALAGNATLLKSRSGFGKSSICRQVFEDLRKSEPNVRWGFGTIFAATQTPPDFIGFQFKGEREFPDAEGKMRTITVTDPSVPLWYISDEGKPAFMYDKFFLVIDEYGQGEADVKRACAEIFLNGGTSPWYLPPGSIRVGCTNEGARYGVTKDFDFCIARRTEIKITPDADVALSFMDKPYAFQGQAWQTLAVTKAWAKQNPTVLFEEEPKEQGPWCNPRSLCAADRYLQMLANSMPDGTIPVNDTGMMEVLAGTIGMAASRSLINHLQFRLELPSYDDVVKDPTGTDKPKRPDLMMLMAYELAGWTKVQDLPAVLTYVGRLPKDIAVTYVTAILGRDYDAIINEPAMAAWINKNASLVSLISSLSAQR